MTSTPTPSGLAPMPFSRATGVDLRSPAGLSLDKGGFWVADTFPGRVHHYAHDGTRRLVIGDGVLREPRDVAVTSDRVYVADSYRGSVEAFTTKGRHLATIGRGPLGHPRGVVVDAAGRILVSDVDHNRVATYDATTYEQTGEITDGIHIPHGMVVDGDALWVVSSSRQYDGNCGVTRYVADQPTVTIGDGQHSKFGFMSNPAHVAIDGDGLVLVTIPDYGFVQRFTPDGEFLDEFGVEGQGLLRQPLGIAVNGRDVHVADSGNRRVVTFRSPR